MNSAPVTETAFPIVMPFVDPNSAQTLFQYFHFHTFPKTFWECTSLHDLFLSPHTLNHVLLFFLYLLLTLGVIKNLNVFQIKFLPHPGTGCWFLFSIYL